GVIAVTEVPEGAVDDTSDGEPSTSADVSALLALLREQHATIRHQSENLTHALASAMSGYSLVRPMPPAPVVLEQTAPPPSSEGEYKPGQLVNIAKAVFEMFRGGAGGAAATPTPGGVP